jgi:hypothetical protein
MSRGIKMKRTKQADGGRQVLAGRGRLGLAFRWLLLSPFLFPLDPVVMEPDKEPPRAASVVSVRLSDFSAIEVITDDTLIVGESTSFEYSVDGLRVLSTYGADTLLWLAPRPVEAVRSALGSGLTTYSERRDLSILSCTPGFISGRVRLRTRADEGAPALFEGFRTWLFEGGIELTIDDVVQRDSDYYTILRSKLGVPDTLALDQWLWSRGFWNDENSFALLPGESSPWLLLGFPSWEGLDTLLTVWLPFDQLTTAIAAQMD